MAGVREKAVSLNDLYKNEFLNLNPTEFFPSVIFFNLLLFFTDLKLYSQIDFNFLFSKY